MNKINLSNQVISLLMVANNECDSTGLYNCRKELLPSIFLNNCDLPFVIKDGYVFIQIGADEFEITPHVWTITALRIVRSFILCGITVEVANILHIISDWLGYHYDFSTRRIQKKVIKRQICYT